MKQLHSILFSKELDICAEVQGISMLFHSMWISEVSCIHWIAFKIS